MNPGNAIMDAFEASEAQRVRAHSIEVHGLLLLRALERHGFPVSEGASTAAMSIEARDLHNAARRFQRVCNSTGRAPEEPKITQSERDQDEFDHEASCMGRLT